MDASIWEEPVVQDSPKRAEKSRPIDVVDIDDDDDLPQRPKKRPRQTLFYADSDDDDVPGPSNLETVLKAPPPHEIDIDALFADVDDDDDDISKPLPTILDEDELARQAEARYKKNPPPLTLHEILPSSSPAREQEGRNGKSREKREDDEKKVRRRQLKLHENLLVSPTGFPQLIKMTKDFRTKGKGHEAVDLDRLLRIYQYWTHQLYPKTTFNDTVERVEKLCHSRRMNVALSVWRDEAHGKFTKINEDVDTGDEEEKDQNMDHDDHTRASLARSSSPIMLNDDHAADPLPSTARTNDHPEDDDAEFWQSMEAAMEASRSEAPSVPPTSAANSSMDEDEDMWDIVNEVEKEAESAATNSAAVAVASGPLPESHPQDDDWDDMYA